jgi:cytochrome c551/c552
MRKKTASRTSDLLRFGLASLILACLSFSAYGQEGTSDADRIWKKSCRKCHDKDGSGGTPAGKKLNVKDYTSAEVQASLTDEEIISATRDGVKDSDGEWIMEPSPELTEAELAALLAMIRGFAIS